MLKKKIFQHKIVSWVLTHKTSLKEDEIKSAMGLIAGSTQVLLVPFFPWPTAQFPYQVVSGDE
jgi:hypothetical protein